MLSLSSSQAWLYAILKSLFLPASVAPSAFCLSARKRLLHALQLLLLIAANVLWCAVYRLVTSAFVHGGLLHVAFNMMAFVPIGASLERMQGTLALAHLIGLLIFIGGGAYVGFATAASYIPWRCASVVHR